MHYLSHSLSPPPSLSLSNGGFYSFLILLSLSSESNIVPKWVCLYVSLHVKGGAAKDLLSPQRSAVVQELKREQDGMIGGYVQNYDSAALIGIQ